MRRLGIVTGLAGEAAIVRRAVVADATTTPLIHCAGPGPDRAAEAARALHAEGARALLSFGLAGGLDPGMRPGTVVAAARVVGADGSAVDGDAAWRDRVLGGGPAGVTMVSAVIVGSDRPLRSADDKAALFAATNAVAVDMESLAVARVAQDAGIPFLALRAIADAASRALPRAALRALDAEGRVRPLAAFAALLAHPGEIGGFVSLARDGRAAFAALRRVATLGPRFGLV